MKTPSPKSERIAGVILLALFLGALVIGGIWFYQSRKNKSLKIPIEEAMYVTDWEITKIYGPGTPQQAKIVDQFQSMRNSKIFFDSPVLYRMNAGSSVNSGEGIMLSPFDPKHPEMALYLKAIEE